jgi:TPR repeat protein
LPYELFMTEARIGSAEAEHMISIMYYKGQGVGQDYQEAFRALLNSPTAPYTCSKLRNFLPN